MNCLAYSEVVTASCQLHAMLPMNCPAYSIQEHSSHAAQSVALQFDWPSSNCMLTCALFRIITARTLCRFVCVRLSESNRSLATTRHVQNA